MQAKLNKECIHHFPLAGRLSQTQQSRAPLHVAWEDKHQTLRMPVVTCGQLSHLCPFPTFLCTPSLLAGEVG